MVRVEEIRKAIAEMPVDELKVYLEETIWEGIEEGSPEEEMINNIRDDAMDPFICGYDNLDLRSGYKKLMIVAGVVGNYKKYWEERGQYCVQKE